MSPEEAAPNSLGAPPVKTRCRYRGVCRDFQMGPNEEVRPANSPTAQRFVALFASPLAGKSASS